MVQEWDTAEVRCQREGRRIPLLVVRSNPPQPNFKSTQITPQHFKKLIVLIKSDYRVRKHHDITTSNTSIPLFIMNISKYLNFYTKPTKPTHHACNCAASVDPVIWIWSAIRFTSYILSQLLAILQKAHPKGHVSF